MKPLLGAKLTKEWHELKGSIQADSSLTLTYQTKQKNVMDKPSSLLSMKKEKVL